MDYERRYHTWNLKKLSRIFYKDHIPGLHMARNDMCNKLNVLNRGKPAYHKTVIDRLRNVVL